MAIEVSLTDLEKLLGMRIPFSYLAYAQRIGVKVLLEKNFDPKTLAVLNLNMRSRDREGWTKDKFLLTGDQLGNYYFISNAPGAAKVLLWSHDPPGIEDPDCSLPEFLDTYEQHDRITNRMMPGSFVICRTELPGESILTPIALTEWKKVVACHSNISYVGHREGRNPFTNEVMRFDWPGMTAVNFENECFNLALNYGRVHSIGDVPNIAVTLLESLANDLDAKVLKG